jgi:hypothetical protein
VPLPRRDLSDEHLIQLRYLHYVSNAELDKRRAAGLSMLGLSKITLCKLRMSADSSKLSDAAVDRMFAHCAKTFGCTETRWPMVSIRKHVRAVYAGDPLLLRIPARAGPHFHPCEQTPPHSRSSEQECTIPALAALVRAVRLVHTALESGRGLPEDLLFHSSYVPDPDCCFGILPCGTAQTYALRRLCACR